MGTVTRAFDRVLKRDVALKFMREDLRSRDLEARFLREGQAMAAFVHPHVVTVFDVGISADGRPFLVMELLEGRTVAERLDVEGPLTPEEVVEIVAQTCAAVTAAHGRGILHRDLKPANLFLVGPEDRATVKVLDFGIAKITEGSATATETASGALIGTPAYMAPERILGGPAQPSWDLWSMSVVAYELLTGSHPFSGESASEMRSAIVEGFPGRSGAGHRHGRSSRCSAGCWPRRRASARSLQPISPARSRRGCWGPAEGGRRASVQRWPGRPCAHAAVVGRGERFRVVGVGQQADRLDDRALVAERARVVGHHVTLFFVPTVGVGHSRPDHDDVRVAAVRRHGPGAGRQARAPDVLESVGVPERAAFEEDVQAGGAVGDGALALVRAARELRSPASSSAGADGTRPPTRPRFRSSPRWPRLGR